MVRASPVGESGILLEMTCPCRFPGLSLQWRQIFSPSQFDLLWSLNLTARTDNERAGLLAQLHAPQPLRFPSQSLDLTVRQACIAAVWLRCAFAPSLPVTFAPQSSVNAPRPDNGKLRSPGNYGETEKMRIPCQPEHILSAICETA